MVTIAEGIAAATFALKAAKDLREIDRSISDADFKLRIADISTTLADIKLAMIDLQDQLREKDDTIAKLSSALRKKAETIVVRGFTYECINGKPAGTAYCEVCLQNGLFFKTYQVTGGYYKCTNCTKTTGGSSEFLYPE